MNKTLNIQDNNLCKRFPIQWGKAFPDEIRLSVLEDIIINAYNRTKLELKNYFNIYEAEFIVDALNGILYASHLSDKNVLFEELNRYAHINNVIDKEFLKKILDLSEFQAFTVIRMAIEFWEDQSNEDDFSIIRRIFNITGEDNDN